MSKKNAPIKYTSILGDHKYWTHETVVTSLIELTNANPNHTIYINWSDQLIDKSGATLARMNHRKIVIQIFLHSFFLQQLHYISTTTRIDKMLSTLSLKQTVAVKIELYNRAKVGFLSRVHFKLIGLVWSVD